MAMWSRKAAVHPPLPTPLDYLEQAAEVRARIVKARAIDHTGDAARADRLAEAKVRATLDEEKVAARVSALREARERNHFTDRIRALLQTSEGHKA